MAPLSKRRRAFMTPTADTSEGLGVWSGAGASFRMTFHKYLFDSQSHYIGRTDRRERNPQPSREHVREQSVGHRVRQWNSPRHVRLFHDCPADERERVDERLELGASASRLMPPSGGGSASGAVALPVRQRDHPSCTTQAATCDQELNARRSGSSSRCHPAVRTEIESRAANLPGR